MTELEWLEMRRLMGRIQVVVWAVFAFVVISILGFAGQRTKDIAALQAATEAQNKALERIEAKLGAPK